jgi:Fe2+ transport system protein FeoA
MPTLEQLNIGEKAELLQIDTEGLYAFCCKFFEKCRCKMGVCSRLEGFPVRVGETVEMLRNEGGELLLVEVRGSRIAISRDLARNFIVRRGVRG